MTIVFSGIGPKKRQEIARLTTGQTDSSGGTATNVVDVFTGAAAGSVVTSVKCVAETTTTDGFLTFFYYDGTNRRAVGSLKVPATTVGATVLPWEGEWIPPGGSIDIPSGSKLQAITRNTEAFALLAKGTDYN
jgi:hypothetical protein